MMTVSRMFSHNRSVLGIGLLFGLSLWAQEPAHRDAMLSSNSVPPELSPLSARAKPPVELFRNLLLMPPQERKDFLTNWPPDAQKLILAKVHEYEALQPEQRELRLRVTELRWYLLPLLNTSATNRTAQVTSIPVELRGLVEDRLAQWDKLSGDAQKKLLDNEATVRFYMEWTAVRPDQRAATVAEIPQAAREQFEAGIRRWQALSGEQRRQVVNNFKEFFNLTPPEQDKTLRFLSEAERLQIDKTLHTFEGLSPSQRAQCLRSFQKLVSLSSDERLQFLKNAEQWKLMTPTERQSWRNLVSGLSHQPPLPGRLNPPPLPSAPTRITSPTGAPSMLVTNTN